MRPGALGTVYQDRPSAFAKFDAEADKLVDAPGVPLALRYFGGAGLAHMKKYGTKLEAFAKFAPRPVVTQATIRSPCFKGSLGPKMSSTTRRSGPE